MNRAFLQQLASVRLDEARSLLDAGYPSGAYYLAGYSLECALKAVIAKSTQQYDFPDLQRVRVSYTHKLIDLIEVAGLKDQLNTQKRSSPEFATGWRVILDWSESSRYSFYDYGDANDMLTAVGDTNYGVFSWITLYW